MMEKENLIVDSGKAMVVKKFTDAQQESIKDLKKELGVHPTTNVTAVWENEEGILQGKIQTSSMYGAIGDKHSGAENSLRGIAQPTLHFDDMGFTKVVDEIALQKGFNTINVDSIPQPQILSEDELREHLTDSQMNALLKGKEQSISIIPAGAVGVGSGKTIMSLKQLAEHLNVDLDSLVTTEDSVFITDPEAAIMPTEFEGFAPGEIAIIDSMDALRRNGMMFDQLQRYDMMENGPQYTPLPLSRTEKRKQQRAKAREERKLRKELKKDAKQTIHQHFQTDMEQRQISEQIINESNKRFIAEINEQIPELRELNREVIQSSTSEDPVVVKFDEPNTNKTTYSSDGLGRGVSSGIYYEVE